MATKKTASKKAAAKKKAPARKKPSKVTANSLTGEELYLYAQEAAYYLAEKNGFSGDPADYWAKAQKELGIG